MTGISYEDIDDILEELNEMQANDPGQVTSIFEHFPSRKAQHDKIRFACVECDWTGYHDALLHVFKEHF
ncbi:MAG: hypothetical protein ACFFCS_13210 [Candidatus Hodarchaeota archaeon]